MRVNAAYVPLQPRRFTIAPNAFGCKRWLATAVPEAGRTIDAVETADELLAPLRGNLPAFFGPLIIGERPLA